MFLAGLYHVVKCTIQQQREPKQSYLDSHTLILVGNLDLLLLELTPY